MILLPANGFSLHHEVCLNAMLWHSRSVGYFLNIAVIVPRKQNIWKTFFSILFFSVRREERKFMFQFSCRSWVKTVWRWDSRVRSSIMKKISQEQLSQADVSTWPRWVADMTSLLQLPGETLEKETKRQSSHFKSYLHWFSCELHTFHRGHPAVNASPGYLGRCTWKSKLIGWFLSLHQPVRSCPDLT